MLAALTTKERRFSLVELLVVIGIVSMLAALLMPALQGARQRAWQANCRSNLRQMGGAIEMYSTNYAYMPPFLSALHPEFLPQPMYICRADPYNGLGGSKPPEPWGDANQFPETNELSSNTDYALRNNAGLAAWETEAGYNRDGYSVSFARSEPKEPYKFRNTDIEGASYMYEFSTAYVPPGWTENETTWHDFKMKQVDEVGTRVPLVRCYYHSRQDGLPPPSLVLNLGYHHGVYDSGTTTPFGWDD